MPHLRPSTFILPTLRQLRKPPNLRLRPSFFLSRPYSYPKEGVFQRDSPPPTQRNIPGFGAPPPQLQNSQNPPQPEPNAYFPPSSQQPNPQYPSYPLAPEYSYNQYNTQPSPSFWRIRWYNGLAFFFLTLTFSLGTILTLTANIPLEPGSDLDKEELAALFEELDTFPLVQQLRSATIASPATSQPQPQSPSQSHTQPQSQTQHPTSHSPPSDSPDPDQDDEPPQTPAFKEWTAYTALPPSRRSTRLTTGPLAGTAGLAAQKVFINDTDHSAYIFVNFGPGTCGWPDVVHSGAISTVFDEALGRVAIRDTKTQEGLQGGSGKTGVTARLEVDFLEGVRSGVWYVVVVKLVPEEMREGFRRMLMEPLEGRRDKMGDMLGERMGVVAGVGLVATGIEDLSDESDEEKTRRRLDMERKKYVTGILACCNEVAPRLEELPMPTVGGREQGGGGNAQEAEIALTDVHPHAIAKALFVVPKDAKTAAVPDGF